MKYFFATTLFSILFSACVDNSNKNQAVDFNLDEEIKERIVRIEAYAKINDTAFIYPKSVDQEVKNLILLSKEIENLQACVGKANAYFLSLSKEFHLNVSDFERLNTGMHINDITTALKQNEMIFFNHILLKSGSDAIPLHSAR